MSAGKCIRGGEQITWLEKRPATKLDNIKCDDSHECKDGETCCRLSSGEWGCCPQQIIRLKKRPASILDGEKMPAGEVDEAAIIPPVSATAVYCPDGSECSDGQTCCPMDSSTTYGCCPLPMVRSVDNDMNIPDHAQRKVNYMHIATINSK